LLLGPLLLIGLLKPLELVELPELSWGSSTHLDILIGFFIILTHFGFFSSSSFEFVESKED
jgi:hypothetical protein